MKNKDDTWPGKFTEKKLDQVEIDELQDQVDRLRETIKRDRKKVQHLLRWLTEATKEELEFVETYFITRDVYKTLLDTLKNPVVYVLEEDTGGN